jgi:hypothetical protein
VGKSIRAERTVEAGTPEVGYKLSSVGSDGRLSHSHVQNFEDELAINTIDLNRTY